MTEVKPEDVLSEVKSFRTELHTSLNHIAKEIRPGDVMSEVKAFREELTDKLQVLIDILYGKNSKLGLIARVHIIWSMWVWLLCTAAAFSGSAITYFLTK